MTPPGAKTVTVSIVADPGTETIVTDARRAKVGGGAGGFSIDLAPGLYKVRFKAGGVSSDQLFEVADLPVQLSAPRLDINSPVPLAGTRTTHEFQEDGARKLPQLAAEKIGHGSEFALFARDSYKKWKEGPPSEPWRGLVLQRLAGITDVDFSETGDRDSERGFAAARVELDPGTYLLTLSRESAPILQLPVVASPGWRTTIFLDCSGPAEKREVDLYGASAVVTRVTDGFEPYDEVLRYAELAKQSLVKGRVTVDARSLSRMMQSKFTYPMVGILAGHVLLLAQEPDFDLLAEVTQNLEKLVPGHPDVLALRIRLALSRNEPGEVQNARVEGPPMLRSSWDIFVEASPRLPHLLPVNAEWMQYSYGLCGSHMWLTWQRPPAAPAKGREFMARPQLGLGKPEWNSGLASIFQALNRDKPIETVLTALRERAQTVLAASDGKLDRKRLTQAWAKLRNALDDPAIAASPLQSELRRKLVSLLESDPDDDPIDLDKLALDLRVPAPVLVQAANALFVAAQDYSPPAGTGKR